VLSLLIRIGKRMTMHLNFGTVGKALAMTAVAMVAMPVQAAPLLFSFSGNVSGSFAIDSDPVPYFVNGVSFRTNFSDGTGFFSGSSGPGTGELDGLDPSWFGGMSLALYPSGGGFLTGNGPQFWSGPLSAPHFVAGSYAMTDQVGNAYSLTISNPGAPAPELAGGLLAGLAAAFALVATRRGKAFRLLRERAC